MSRLRCVTRGTLVVVALSVMLGPLVTPARAAATYTWAVASGDWTNANSWNPPRVAPANDDILVFDGSTVSSANVTLVPNQVIGQLKLTNFVTVSLNSGVAVAGTGTISEMTATVTGVGTSFTTQVALGDIIYGNVAQNTHEVTAIGNNTTMTVTLPANFGSQAWSIAPKLMPSGGPGDDFVIDAGSTLRIASNIPPISIVLPTGATARIAGNLTFMGNVHRLNAADANAIVVAAGGVITTEIGYAGSPFTVTGTANAVRFQAGSTFVQKAGANPFGLVQPASKVIFDTGSLYQFLSPLSPSLSGRTYANFEMNSTAVSVATGTGTFTADNITLDQGGIAFSTLANVVIHGNLLVAPLGVFADTGSTVVKFSGTTPQLINSIGTVTFGPHSTLVLDNPAGLGVALGVTVDGTLTVLQGNLGAQGGTLTLGPDAVFNPGSSWVIGTLARHLLPSVSPVTATFAIGDALHALPVTVTFPSIGAAGDLAVETASGDHPSLGSSTLDPIRSVNRNWHFTNTGVSFPSCSVTLSFDPGDLDPLADGNKLSAGKYDFPSWSYPPVLVRQPTSIQVGSVTSFSDFAVADPVIPRVNAGPAPSCISNAAPCVSVPVALTATSGMDLRALATTIQLSPELQLCDPTHPLNSIHAGSWLASFTNSFQVIDRGGGAYEIDAAILGQPCGQTTGGQLFTLDLTNAGADGTGSMTVTAVTARDCSNGSVDAGPGNAAPVTIDRTDPGTVLLTAAQRMTGNAPLPPNTTDILLSWTGQPPATTVNVYRRGFGGYPQYDENGGIAPSAPTTAAGAVAAGWQLTPVHVSGGADRVPGRDFYYYVAFVTDACGNSSVASTRTDGTLDYHLGDVTDGMTDCAGDGLVSTADLSLLGAHYGVTLPIDDPLECLDIGPTTTVGVEGRPTTDNRLDFEDLVLYALDFGLVSAPARDGGPPASARDAVWIDAPERVHAGDVITATLWMSGTGRIQAVSSNLAWDTSVLVPDATASAGWIESQGGVVMSPAAGAVDAALLGVRDHALAGDGAIATVRFHAARDGATGLRVASAIARDAANHAVDLAAGSSAAHVAPPTATALAAAAPSPFGERTTLEFALAHGADVRLAIYGVDGRRIRSLAEGVYAPGTYRMSWDGTDDSGHPVAAGVYFARLVADGARFTRTLVRVR